MASGGRRVTISYSRSGVGTGVGGGVLVAIGFAVFLSGVGVAVSGRGVCSTLLFCGAAVAVGAVAGVFGSGLADTVSARGVRTYPAQSLRSAQPPVFSCPGLPIRFPIAA